MERSLAELRRAIDAGDERNIEALMNTLENRVGRLNGRLPAQEDHPVAPETSDRAREAA